MKDMIYWIWFALKCGAGSSEGVKLLEYFDGAREIYEADSEELFAADKCDREFLNRFGDRDLSRAEDILEFCFLNEIRIVCCASEEYPSRLNSLYNKPLVLYVRGNIANLTQRLCIGVVGTRQMSDYGKHAAFDIVRNLCSYGAVIISGAAYGIDTVANNTALYFESETIAVLGSGVNVPYPSENKDMLDRIAECGMVISEFAPGTAPAGYHFPIRNRIISGLSDGLLVVEAGEKSGALITARTAADQGRYVYAVPGCIDMPVSLGPNLLIRDGAKLCMRAEDIVGDFADSFSIERLEAFLKSEKYQRYEMRSKQRSNTPQQTVARRVVQNTQTQKTQPTPVNQSVKAPVQINPIVQPPVSKTEKIKNSRECVYTKLNETQKRVFDAMPDGAAVLPDELAKTGIPAGDIMSSLTILELYSAAEALPGGMYRKLV